MGRKDLSETADRREAANGSWMGKERVLESPLRGPTVRRLLDRLGF